MPDKTGAMILSTLMMLAVASALSASTPQRNLSSCCSCHGTTQGVRRTHQGSRRAHGVGPGHGCSGPTSIPEPLNTCAGRLTVSDSISSKEGVCCVEELSASASVAALLLPERVREHLAHVSSLSG